MFRPLGKVGFGKEFDAQHLKGKTMQKCCLYPDISLGMDSVFA